MNPVEKLAHEVFTKRLSERVLIKRFEALYMKGVDDAMDSFWDGLPKSCRDKYEKYLKKHSNIGITRLK